jgi:DNA mismatch repair protein MutS
VSTPIRLQYLELKGKHPDSILFFRLGDFYETFDEDAKLVSKALGIVLTSKPMGKGIRVPLAGVPHHSMERHVGRLVELGYRVAICEQMADPSTSKGLVPRDVVRIVTAGTITNEAVLMRDSPSYLAVLVEYEDIIGFVVADIATGEIRFSDVNQSMVEIDSFVPAELLVEDVSIVPTSADSVVVVRPAMHFSIAQKIVHTQFGEIAQKTFGENSAVTIALAQLIRYLEEVYPAALGALQRLRPLSSSTVLNIDHRTLANLDVLPKDGKHSLFGVLNQTSTAMGARLLRQWLMRPLREPELLSERHDAVEWCFINQIKRAQLINLLKQVDDLSRICGRIGTRSVSPRDLNSLRKGLLIASKMIPYLEGSSVPLLFRDAMSSLESGLFMLATLQDILVLDPPSGFEDGGVIASGYNSELDVLRFDVNEARSFLASLEAREQERTGIKSLKVGQNKNFGYYLEVSTANIEKVPENFQRRQTLVGGERYVTEELKRHEVRLVTALDSLVSREKEIFEELINHLQGSLEELQGISETLATIDVVLALGEVAVLKDYVRPRCVQNADLMITTGRHPIVEVTQPSGSFVANDCFFVGQKRILVLTGPNMSGKSTYLRQVALIVLMAQIGSFVPAKQATLPFFDRIFTRIGAQDDLAAGQSTFMVEMLETAQILHQSTPDSLVILDEVGRGTSTFDGLAIAHAVLESLNERLGGSPITLFATHYHELTVVADELISAENAHVSVQGDGEEVVFEHRIQPGPSDQSYGVHVARLAGLPNSVISRAETLLVQLEKSPKDYQVQSELFRTELGDLELQSNFQSELEEEISALDIDVLTPLDALNLLSDFHQKVRKKELER